MLEEKDMQALKTMMETVIDNRLSKSENMILSEMDRVQERMEEQIQKVKSNLEEMKQYYRINKLEQENTTILLEMIKSLQKEVDELKRKIA